MMTVLEFATKLSTELVDLGLSSITPDRIVVALHEVQMSEEVTNLLNVLREETKQENELSLLGIGTEHQERSFEYENARCAYSGTITDRLLQKFNFDTEPAEDEIVARKVVMAFHEFETYTDQHSDEVMAMYPHRK